MRSSTAAAFVVLMSLAGHGRGCCTLGNPPVSGVPPRDGVATNALAAATDAATEAGDGQGIEGPRAAADGSFVVDVGASLGVISPGIYGVAFASRRSLEVATVHRFGGDCSSMYNWKVDAFNCGQDWQYENQPLKGFGYPPFNDEHIPAGLSAIDYMIQTTRRAGSDVLMTVPTIGWVAKDDHSAGDSSGKNPAQTATKADGAFVQEWVRHLVSTFGTASNGGVKYYQLDNEPDNWSKMHPDVHPKAASGAEIWDEIRTYGGAIKAADPSATVLAYSPATLEALVYSPLDETKLGIDQPQGPPLDSSGHVVRPFAAWLLKQAAAYEKQTGVRVIDCLDIHYPTAGDHPVSDTRSLWDATYDEHSWLTQYCYHGPLEVLPRIRRWIDESYPGTGVCISEYTYYGDGGKDGVGDTPADPHSGVVQADALGIFGKYGVRVANYWTTLTGPTGRPTPTRNAFAMYRDYDGKGGHFGDHAVEATSRTDGVAIYAATDAIASPHTLWVMLVNKNESQRSDLALAIERFAPGPEAVEYQSIGAAPPRIVSNIAIRRRRVVLSLPALSISLLVIPNGVDAADAGAQRPDGAARQSLPPPSPPQK